MADRRDKPLVWLHGVVASPPLSQAARVETGVLLRRLIYRLDPDAVVIVEVFRKTTRATPNRVIETCRRRLRAYDEAVRG